MDTAIGHPLAALPEAEAGHVVGILARQPPAQGLEPEAMAEADAGRRQGGGPGAEFIEASLQIRPALRAEALGQSLPRGRRQRPEGQGVRTRRRPVLRFQQFLT